MVFFDVGLELGVDLVISLFCREFTPGGKTLAAIRTPPRDRIAIDFFCNNQLRHETMFSQIRCFTCAIENGPSFWDFWRLPLVQMAYRHRKRHKAPGSFKGRRRTSYVWNRTSYV